MPKGDRPNRFKIIPKENVEKEIDKSRKYNFISANGFKDISGQTFADGNVAVICRYHENTKDGKAQWICKCNLCGNYFYVSGKSLRTGNTRSCGCLVSKKCAERNTKFGLIDTELGYRIYKIHFDMIRRCYNPKRDDYKRYGGRGIYIVPEWYTPNDPNNSGFVNFYNWMIENDYKIKSGMSVDRIDNDGLYAPWNCRLANRYEQGNNRRTNKFIVDIGGEVLTYAQFERLYNLPDAYISSALHEKRNITLDVIVHNAHIKDIKDRAYLDKKDGEYKDRYGFIHLIDVLNDIAN